MSQNVELDRVKDRIRKLAARTVEAGASESEAETAMRMVGDLLSQYNLSMSEIDVRETKCKLGTVRPINTKHHDATAGTYTVVASLADCKVWRDTHDHTYNFYGFPEDVDMAVYLVQVIQSASQAEYARFKQTDTWKNRTCHGRYLTTSFYRGMSTRIAKRLRDIITHMEDEQERAEQYLRENTVQVGATEQAQVQGSTGTSLVVLKRATVEDAFKTEFGFKLRSSKRTRRAARHSGAYNAGQTAGDRVNLNRPVGDSNGSVSGLLK